MTGSHSPAAVSPAIELLQVIHDSASVTYTLTEQAAAARLLKRGVTVTQAADVLCRAGEDPFWRGKITSAESLERHWEHWKSIVTGSPGPARVPEWHGRPEPGPAADLETFGAGHRLPPDVEAQKAALIARIREAEAKGLRGPALGRYVLGRERPREETEEDEECPA